MSYLLINFPCRVAQLRLDIPPVDNIARGFGKPLGHCGISVSLKSFLMAYHTGLGELPSHDPLIMFHFAATEFIARHRVTDNEVDRFKSSLSRECPSYFIGMWDCVRVIGAFSRRRTSPSLPDKTAFGYHALAIDETRRFFKPLLWENAAVQDQTLEQVWFPGVHGDISGGYAERGLSDIALQWMLDKANAAGMLIDQQQYEALRPDPLAEMHDSRIGAFGLFPSQPRRIPEGAMLHPSVELRVRQSDYSPGNIKNI